MKIAVIDTYYPPFLASMNRSGTYPESLQETLGRFFGTFDAYSRHLGLLGWETLDIVANDGYLQGLWAGERGFSGASLQAIALRQIEEFAPDVVFMQDLSFFDPATLAFLAGRYLLAGQCSCPMPNAENVSKFKTLFTSFPHYVDRFAALGVDAVYLPLAFDPIVLERSRIPSTRTHVAFVGGYGRHWDVDGLFTTLAERTPIEFWGYGYDRAPEVVRRRWRGQAWGREMYDIYLRSHIVLNRHGGVAEGYANNLRLFEATGCAAMLLTEYAPNLTDFFSDDECVAYTSAEDAAERINYYLQNPVDMQMIAAKGQYRTINDHNYFKRLRIASDRLRAAVRQRVAQ